MNEQKYDLAIPRYMAVKMLVLAMNIPANEHENNSYYRYMNEIRDFNSIDGRYAYLVVRGYCNGIINGDEHGNFDPYSDLTRAEACAIISRALGGSVVPAQNEAIATQAPVKRGGGVSENGWLKVSGTQLVNSAGEPVVLHGMSSHGLHWFPQFVERDAIAFTAGIGENDADTRAGIVSYLGYLGIELCEERNKVRGENVKISTDDSKVAVCVIPTNEELAICRDTVAVISANK